MMAPPACHALQETLSNGLSVIRIRQMGGVYSESAPSRCRRRWEWLHDDEWEITGRARMAIKQLGCIVTVDAI